MTSTTADAARHTIRAGCWTKSTSSRGAVPILRAIQDELGHVSPAAVPKIADGLA